VILSPKCSPMLYIGGASVQDMRHKDLRPILSPTKLPCSNSISVGICGEHEWSRAQSGQHRWRDGRARRPAVGDGRVGDLNPGQRYQVKRVGGNDC
jgi:hypothetical protein